MSALDLAILGWGRGDIDGCPTWLFMAALAEKLGLRGEAILELLAP